MVIVLFYNLSDIRGKLEVGEKIGEAKVEVWISVVLLGQISDIL